MDLGGMAVWIKLKSVGEVKFRWCVGLHLRAAETVVSESSAMFLSSSTERNI